MKKLYFLLAWVPLAATAQTGSLCTDPIVIASLPFSTSDDTANYGDNYDPQTTSSPTCSTTTFGNYYHGGNDVIYSYTPTSNGSITVSIPSAAAWTGMFIYTDCANIGISYAACATGPSDGARTISDFAVTAGQTYYIFISSWPDPQTVAYTLNVTGSGLGVSDAQAEQVVLFPNPASDYLNISGPSVFTSATVYNVNGQKVISRGVFQNRLDVSELAAGMYIVELTAADGNLVRRKFARGGK